MMVAGCHISFFINDNSIALDSENHAGVRSQKRIASPFLAALDAFQKEYMVFFPKFH